MAHILAEKEAEKTNLKYIVLMLFERIARPFRSLDPVLLVAANGKMFEIMQEYEWQQLRVNSERPICIRQHQAIYFLLQRIRT